MFIYSDCNTLTEDASRFMDMSKCQYIFMIYGIKDYKLYGEKVLKRSEYQTYFEVDKTWLHISLFPSLSRYLNSVTHKSTGVHND